MKNLLVSPSVDIVEFVGDLLLKDKDNLCENLIVFPGKRPSHFLRKYLADELKTSFKAPKIFSIDEFIDFVYKYLGYTDRMINAIDGVSIIFDLNKDKELIIDDNARLTLDDFLPWGFKIFSDFEEMYIELIKPSRLKGIETIAGEKLPIRIQQKLTSLSTLYESFYDFFPQNNISTRASRYREVANNIENVDFDIFKKILLIGFFALTESEKRIFGQLEKKSNTSIIFQKGPGIESLISKLQVDVEEKGEGAKAPEINFYKAMDVHGEIFALNQTISKEEGFTRKDLIVLPSADTLFPVVQHTLGSAGNEYNISMGYPLFRTPVYALIETLGKLMETRGDDDYYIPDYLKFVLHPYVKNIYLDRASYPTRIIFHTIEEQFVRQERRFIKLEEIEEDKKIISDCVRKLATSQGAKIDRVKIKSHLSNIHRILIKPFETIKNIEDFADKLLHSISFISQNSQASMHPYTVPFIKTMIDGLYELKTSILKNENFVKTGSYFRLLRNYTRAIRYPFSGTPVKGLQVLGFLETRSIKFDTVYFLDVNEGIVPHTKKEDTLLPYKMRKFLKLPTHEDREKISKYYFNTLLGGAKQVHIFYVEGADKEKSRFVERLEWELQKKTRKLESSTREVFFRVQFSQKDPKSVKKNDDVMKYIIEKVKFSQSNLDTYLHCPLRFYCQYILRLRGKEGITDDLEPKDIGSKVHAVLQKFFILKLGKKLVIKEEDYNHIEKIVEDEFNKSFTHSDVGSIYLIKSQIKRRMKYVLDFHKKKYKNIVILECENQKKPYLGQKYRQGKEILLELPSGYKIKLRGRIDRVDKRNGKIYIIDYKTGKDVAMPNAKNFDISKREEWFRTLGSVQLPFYLLLYLGENKDISIDNINSSLMILGSKTIEEKLLFKEHVDLNEKIEMYELYKKAILTLVEEILNPKIDFDPTSDPEGECYRCDFRVICGRQWMIKKW